MNTVDKALNWAVDVCVSVSVAILEWQGWKIEHPLTDQEWLAEHREFHRNHVIKRSSSSPYATYTETLYVSISDPGTEGS